MKKLLPILLLALAACGSKTFTVDRPVITYVPVKAPCPSAEETARLKAARPAPLAGQAVPPTAVERSARINAQLGEFEAPGRWADQVVTALDRCQVQ